MGAFTNLIQCGGVEGGDGAYTHVGAYIRVREDAQKS